MIKIWCSFVYIRFEESRGIIEPEPANLMKDVRSDKKIVTFLSCVRGGSIVESYWPHIRMHASRLLYMPIFL